MTPEAQRIAIAEACGWRQDLDPRAIGFWSPPDNQEEFIAEVPDYLNDLNAMHEAERVLALEQRIEYYLTLYELVGKKKYAESASATQRAEAFLRTLNLWKESQSMDTVHSTDLDSTKTK